MTSIAGQVAGTYYNSRKAARVVVSSFRNASSMERWNVHVDYGFEEGHAVERFDSESDALAFAAKFDEAWKRESALAENPMIYMPQGLPIKDHACTCPAIGDPSPGCPVHSGVTS